MTNNQTPLKSSTPSNLAVVPLGIALNLALGWIVFTLKLPIYLDAIGTILITLIAGVRPGIIVGVASFLLGGLMFNSVLPWFSGTQVVIAVYTHLVGRRGGFRSIGHTVLSGLGMGLIAGIVSAPVIVILFGGLTGNGTALVSAFFLKTGQGLIKSVFLSGIACEPLDKALQCVLAFVLLKGVPKSILSTFRNGTLEKNGLIRAKDES